MDTKSVLVNRIPASVLLLEDDRKIRKILTFFLTDLSYTTLEASTPDEGVALLKEHPECQVLIMDWRLGNEDPHRVIEQLRKIRNGLIVIVVSGYSPKQNSIKKMNIFRWLTKPYDKNRLDLEIQKALYVRSKE